MKRIVLSLLLGCALCIHLSAQQQTNLPKTLLWRISGNGLLHDSYLYGTMHLQDKRLFYFGDSLYHYLESAEGYAMEIDLQEFADSLIQKVIDQRTDELLYKEYRNTKDKNKMIDSLINNVRKFNDKESKKQLQRIRQDRLQQVMKHKEMSTIMDAYLYNIAQREGKWLGGIEDVQDQLSLVDELGGDMSSKDFKGSDQQLENELEKLVNIYIAQDLSGIERYSAADKDGEGTVVFHRRNRKMAYRMDSLNNVRSMFFTVGAAHLPGDSGVIALLRRKGYSVEPVFSKQKVDPVQYASRLSSLPWVQVTDSSGTFRVEMPGKPSEVEVFGSLKMKMLLDLGSMSYYMAGSVYSPSSQSIDINELVNNFARNTEGTIRDKKIYEKDGMKVAEFTTTSKEVFFRVQYRLKESVIFMLMAGGDKETVLDAPDTRKFFQSFVALKTSMPARNEQWTSFSVPGKACSIEWPKKFKENPLLEKKAGNANWKFKIYDCLDASTGFYYMLQIRDLIPGYHLTGDSIFFTSYRESLKSVTARILREEQITMLGLPAYRLDIEMNEPKDVVYKTLSISRGNRIYTLMAGTTTKFMDESLVEHFFQSFTLKDYELTEWKQQQMTTGNFYALSPSPFTLISQDSSAANADDETKTERYVSFNSNTVVSYEIYKTPISPYHWYANDSTLLATYIKQYRVPNDSILRSSVSHNGNLEGVDWLEQMPGNSLRRRMRVFLNGDTIYTLVAHIPASYVNDPEHDQFFDSFRMIKENPHPTVFKSKAAQLLKDLQSADSVTFARATRALADVNFHKEDLPLLHQALLANYPDDTLEYYANTRSRIIGAVEDLTDSSTIDFIRSQFPLLKGTKESRKFDLLEVLARKKTTYSYSVLKELLLNQTPLAKDTRGLSYQLTDSILLARPFFPDILKLSGNPFFADRIMSMSREMLDSEAISPDMLKPYESTFMHIADTTLGGLQHRDSAEIGGYAYLDMLHLVSRFNDAAGNSLLQRYLLINNQDIRQEAALDLLRNDQPVNALQLGKLAADKDYRRSLYDEMTRLGKEKLFPAKYMTQRMLAESDMYAASYDEDEPAANMVFVGERTAVFRGTKQKFYLYKITYEYEEDEDSIQRESYLGVAGPFPIDPKNYKTNNAATGLYYKDNYNAKKLDEYFAAYLKQLGEDDADE